MINAVFAETPLSNSFFMGILQTTENNIFQLVSLRFLFYFPEECEDVQTKEHLIRLIETSQGLQVRAFLKNTHYRPVLKIAAKVFLLAYALYVAIPAVLPFLTIFTAFLAYDILLRSLSNINNIKTVTAASIAITTLYSAAIKTTITCICLACLAFNFVYSRAWKEEYDRFTHANLPHPMEFPSHITDKTIQEECNGGSFGPPRYPLFHTLRDTKIYFHAPIIAKWLIDHKTCPKSRMSISMSDLKFDRELHTRIELDLKKLLSLHQTLYAWIEEHKQLPTITLDLFSRYKEFEKDALLDQISLTAEFWEREHPDCGKLEQVE